MGGCPASGTHMKAKHPEEATPSTTTPVAMITETGPDPVKSPEHPILLDCPPLKDLREAQVLIDAEPQTLFSERTPTFSKKALRQQTDGIRKSLEKEYWCIVDDSNALCPMVRKATLPEMIHKQIQIFFSEENITRDKQFA
eukprot:gene11146-3342_t